MQAAPVNARRSNAREIAMSDCPSREELFRWMSERSRNGGSAIDAHVQACPACHQVLKELSAGYGATWSDDPATERGIEEWSDVTVGLPQTVAAAPQAGLLPETIADEVRTATFQPQLPLAETIAEPRRGDSEQARTEVLDALAAETIATGSGVFSAETTVGSFELAEPATAAAGLAAAYQTTIG